MSKDKFRSILEEMLDLYAKKSGDYGTSFHDIYSITSTRLGTVNLCTRIIEKSLRVINIVDKGEQHVTDESIRETIMDIANYAVLGIMELDDSSQSNNDRKVVTGFRTHATTDNEQQGRHLDLKQFIGRTYPAQKGITANRNPHAVIGIGVITDINVEEKLGEQCVMIKWDELKDVKTGKPLSSGSDMKSWYPIEGLPEYGLYDIYVEYKKNSL